MELTEKEWLGSFGQYITTHSKRIYLFTAIIMLLTVVSITLLSDMHSPITYEVDGRSITVYEQSRVVIDGEYIPVPAGQYDLRFPMALLVISVVWMILAIAIRKYLVRHFQKETA